MKIEKNIPMPDSTKKNRFEFLKNMEMGDSVFLENESTYSKFYTAMKAASKKIKIRIAARKVEGGIRVWRVE